MSYWRVFCVSERWEVAAVYVALLSLFFWKRGRLPKIAVAVGFSVIAATEIAIPLTARPAGPALTMLDVGQGEAALLELPGPYRMLINGGGSRYSAFDVGRNVVAPVFWDRRISKLDVVALTDSRPECFDGLRFICKNFKVGQFWWTGGRSRDPRFADLMQILADQHIPIVPINSDFKPPDSALKDLSVLAPDAADQAAEAQDGSTYPERSLVMRYACGRGSMLISGAASPMLQSRLRAGGALRSTILLMSRWRADEAEHGDLDGPQPQIALVSCGSDGRGGPDDFVIKSLEQAGVTIYRTDRDGAVRAVLDAGGRAKVERLRPDVK